MFACKHTMLREHGRLQLVNGGYNLFSGNKPALKYPLLTKNEVSCLMNTVTGVLLPDCFEFKGQFRNDQQEE